MGSFLTTSCVVLNEDGRFATTVEINNNADKTFDIVDVHNTDAN